MRISVFTEWWRDVLFVIISNKTNIILLMKLRWSLIYLVGTFSLHDVKCMNKRGSTITVFKRCSFCMLEFGFSYLYFILLLLSQSYVLWWLTCDTVWLYPSFLTSTITFPCFHVASLPNSTVNAALILTTISIESGLTSCERKQVFFQGMIHDK